MKAVKVIVAAVMLTLVTAAFFGAPTWMACMVQPMAGWGFFAILVLALLLGRFFCEAMCPLGIVQSIVNKIIHPKKHVRRVCTRLPESDLQKEVRWSVFALFAVLLATGYGAVAWMFTPYSIYGKMLTLFAPGVVLFAVVVVLAAFGKGRIWCNWICPAGTLFNILSRKALLGNKVAEGCGNCKACFPKKTAADDKNKPQDEDGGITRREALKGFAALAAVAATEKTTDGGFASVSLPGSPERPATVLPPGARDRDTFRRLCVGCGACIANCNGKCLKASTDLKGFGQPEMDFRYGYCLSGCEQKCAKVCPANALVKYDDVPKKHIHTGHAIWKKDRCLRFTEDVECKACSRKCPHHAIHIVEGFPVVDKDKCTGCGACEHVCPARPMPAIFVKGYDHQNVIRPMGENEVVGELGALIRRGASVAVARDGVIIGSETGEIAHALAKFERERKLLRSIVMTKKPLDGKALDIANRGHIMKAVSLENCKGNL